MSIGFVCIIIIIYQNKLFLILYITGPSNISGPSFPGQKKRRALRVHKTVKKTTQSQNHAEKVPVPEKQTRDVFDRLSRLSTISFSNKIQQQNSLEKEKKPLKQPTAQSKSQQPTDLMAQETEQYQLDSSMPIKSVAERIARFENTLFPKKRLKSKITNSFPLHQKKPPNSINAQTSFAQIPEHSHAHRQSSPVRDSSTSSKYPSIEHPEDKSHQLPHEQPSPVTKRRSLYNELQSSRQQTVDKAKQGVPSPQPTPSIVPSVDEQPQENEQHSNESLDEFFDSFFQPKLHRSRATHDSRIQNKTPVIEEKQDETTRNFFNDLKKPNQQTPKENAVLSLHNEPKEKKHKNQDQSTRNFFNNLLKSSQQKPKSHPVRNYSQINERIEAVREEIRIASRPIQVYTDEPFIPSKKRHYVPDSAYFIDERIKRARQVLKASKERTQKWMKELSVNQATNRTQHNIINEKQRKTK